MSQASFTFDLDDEMLQTIQSEFDPKEVVDVFAAATVRKSLAEIESIGKQIFGNYGRDLMKRTLELGERYVDRPYEVLKVARSKGAIETFPSIPQRFLEIAYLSTQNVTTLTVEGSTTRNLIYSVPEADCLTFAALKAKCGDSVSGHLPCKHACLSLCETLCNDMNLKAVVSMTASMPKDGYCRFALAQQALR